MPSRLGNDLEENQARLARILHWPREIGIHIQRAQAGRAGPEARLFWVDKLVESRLIRSLLAWLGTGPDLSDPESCSLVLPLPGLHLAADLPSITAALYSGHAALLAEGWDRAILIDMASSRGRDALHLSGDPHMDLFDQDLRSNVAMLRWRLQDPRLRAVPVPIRRPERGSVAMVYMEGKARPSLVRLVRLWAGRHLGEETIRRGTFNPSSAVFGLLPRLDVTRWPDQAARLADSGHILLLADRTTQALVAPITAAAWLSSPSDFQHRLPASRWQARLRILLYLLVLILPGTTASLMNYHTDMIPTAFLAAITSVRENAPFGILFDILIMELLVEIGREAAWRLPVRVPIGQVLITHALISVLVIQAGLIGPLGTLTALIGALVSLALPSYSGTYLIRVWRFYLFFAAIAFGFFGMATVLTMMVTYLCIAKPWGIPFISPTGWAFTTAETQATVGGRRSSGGTRNGKVPAPIR